MRAENSAIHMEVLHAISGRLRVQLEKEIPSEIPFYAIDGVRQVQYNPLLRTLLCRYDPDKISEDCLLMRMGAIYAGMRGNGLLHIRHAEDEEYKMSAGAWLALGAIAADMATRACGYSLASVTRWVSIIATLSAVTEHGYQELNTRGSFDPEVMSVVYLINAIGKTNESRAGLVAWIVTFGRHLFPKPVREEAYLVCPGKRSITITPVKNSPTVRDFAGNMFSRGVESLAKKV